VIAYGSSCQLENKLSLTQEQLKDLKTTLASSSTTRDRLKGGFGISKSVGAARARLILACADEVTDLTRAIRDKEDEISNLMMELSQIKEDKEAVSATVH
jgi:chromosome segregation ATPase